MTDLPDPPVPHECDCRGLDMPIKIDALMKSDLLALATGDEFKAAFLLWLAAWESVPAASLPDDERFLASKAKLSLADFRASREMIMHGFYLAADGLLYHDVIASQARKAFKFRASQARKSAARWGDGNPPGSRTASPGISPGIKGRKSPGISRGSGNRVPGDGETHPGGMPYIDSSPESSVEQVPLASSLRSESKALDLIFDAFEKDRDCTDAEAWSMAVGMFAQRGGLSDRRARQLVGKFAKDFSLSTFEIARAALSTWRSGTRSPEPYFRKAAESAANDRGTSAAAKPRHADAGEYWPVEVQRRWLIELRDNPLAWRPERGPAPGLTGCRVEARLLAEFGYPDPTDPESFA